MRKINVLFFIGEYLLQFYCLLFTHLNLREKNVIIYLFSAILEANI